ncbi:Prpf38a [Columba guinea]|nr:Prpf38a [Columba guinea]
MANRTVKDAHSIHGTNPQYLVEKIIRTRIYESKYWKEECFGLTAELVVDKAMELKYVGGVYGGNIKPTPFLCLTLKMLQIQPEKDIIVEFIKNEDFKYVRMLGALYMRLTGTAIDCYKYLEPLYNDYRKIKSQNRNGATSVNSLCLLNTVSSPHPEFELMHVDEFIDELLHEERVCDIILPRLQKRYVLEEAEQLEPRVSALEEDMDDVESSEEEEEEDEKNLSSLPAVVSSWSEHPLLTTAEEATETLINLADLRLCGTGGAEAGLREGEAALQREEVHHHAGRGIAAKAQDDTGADPGRGATDQDLNLQVIIVVTDTEVIPNHLKDLRKVTRRVGEGMNNKSSTQFGNLELQPSTVLFALRDSWIRAGCCSSPFNPSLLVQVLVAVWGFFF